MLLVAPEFSASSFPEYQRLASAGRGRRADLALQRILREVAHCTGAPADRLALFGYSGGAQFVHRFVMAHPRRVMAAVVASAGWYTFPDLARAYPFGIRRGLRLPDVDFDPAEFLRVPIAVIAGERDDGRDESLPRSARLDVEQGTTRMERARRWVAAMREAAVRYGIPAAICLRSLPLGDHSFAKSVANDHLADAAFSFLLRFTWRPVDWRASAPVA